MTDVQALAVVVEFISGDCPISEEASDQALHQDIDAELTVGIGNTFEGLVDEDALGRGVRGGE
ncbi:hypothetical protein C1889_24445 [Pseudomonas sp. FW507-12TSA]|nr:hypothetical protein C1889_24445 [Pseudomonas sp. FW507-12TSA]